jgi:hypothetical protein
MDSLDDLRCKFWTLGREIFGGGEANLLLSLVPQVVCGSFGLGQSSHKTATKLAEFSGHYT